MFSSSTLVSVNTNPKGDKRQNVTLRFKTIIKGKMSELEKEFSHAYNEKDEVGEIRFVPVEEIDSIDFAFNHKKILKRELSKLDV